MAGLVMAAALAASLCAGKLDPDFVVSLPLRAPPAKAFWYDVSADEFGPGVVGQAGFDADPVALSVAVSYRAAGFGPEASVAAFAGRKLSARTRLDLRAWRGLSRATGGFGAGITLTHAFGPPRR